MYFFVLLDFSLLKRTWVISWLYVSFYDGVLDLPVHMGLSVSPLDVGTSCPTTSCVTIFPNLQLKLFNDFYLHLIDLLLFEHLYLSEVEVLGVVQKCHLYTLSIEIQRSSPPALLSNILYGCGKRNYLRIKRIFSDGLRIGSSPFPQDRGDRGRVKT